MKLLDIIMLLGIVSVIGSGCSAVSYQSSKREIATERIFASGDQNAVNAMRMGVPPESAVKAIQIPGGVVMAVDISAIDVLMKHPVRQVLSAAGDAVLLYGAYEGVLWLQDQFEEDEKDKSVNIIVNNSDDTTIITGDDNDVDDSETTIPVTP